MKMEGGLLRPLAGLIPFLTGTVLPALEVGDLSGLASTGVQKTNWKWVVSKERNRCMSDRN